ncbi:MAG: hypothetical protein PWP46_1758 [Fusobacteriaceae bacterium]|jgi:sucrose porin|nr:putative maltoporin (maltose/maltodextrin high-affinity receptor, phage lambda receptor protein) [Fusobacteriales bacterium]MDN5304872.1 hypothetical protein [Fusobacteriaceae bacterium]
MKKRLLLFLFSSLTLSAYAGDWDIHGYVNTGFTVDSSLNAVETDLGKGDFFLGNNPAQSANQFEISGSRKFSAENGAEGALYFRTEYGNGTAGEKYLYSSSGGEGKDNFFELKEAYIDLAKLDFLPEGSKMWAGRRFYGRDSTACSGEFWKQTSGVGLGYESDKFAVAFVGVDYKKPSDSAPNRQTAFVLDTRLKGFEVPGGNVEFQVNLYTQPDAQKESGDSNEAENGIGLGLTYNINGWYGLNGWSKAAVAYGTGIGANAKGLNFGNWVGGADEDAESLLATTYGMWNISDTIQMGTEASLHQGTKLYGQEKLTRMGFSVSPSYKVTNNLRFMAEASVGMQTLDNPGAWGRSEDTEMRTAFKFSPVITINNDYYGRPQIKPFIAFGTTNDDNVDLYDGEQSGTFFGVQGEVWF